MNEPHPRAEGHIPKNLLQFWHNHDHIPVEMQEALDGTRKHHGDYRIIFADDGEMRALLSAPHRRELLFLYDLLRLPSSRSDLARLVLLQEYGGFYLDAAMQFHVSLDTFLPGDPELILVQRDDHLAYRDCPEKAHVMGGIIGAPARSPFIALCLEHLTANLLAGTFNTRAWNAAGPGVINQALRTYQTTRPIKKLSFTKMLAGAVSYRRSPGVSNVWVEKQKNGIIDPALYAAGPLILSP